MAAFPPIRTIISFRYQWTKVDGPASFTIANANSVTTRVTSLVEGVYRFELKVTDAGGLFSKDMVQVTVNPPPDIYVAGVESVTYCSQILEKRAGRKPYRWLK